jgi:glutamyl-tRNA synthetase
MSTVRVRVAPSPTGDPHVGLAYVMLFNFIFAKKNSGKVILRIEDTDQNRYKKESEKRIIKSLAWLKLNWDEGPDIGGKYGPYRQSERKEIYLSYAEKLIKSSCAYRCFCTPERISKLKEERKKSGLMPKYDRLCQKLSKEQIDLNLKNKNPYVIRLKVADDETIVVHDELRKDINITSEQIDDQILIKSDGFPTYHLANVVDDHLMDISHVIRAEEWISSTPKHILLYKAFGWKQPKFIHLPLLRNSDQSKISKRKNPISLDFYRKKGILPEAMLNFLALMGWSYGNDQEIFSLQEMSEKFNLGQINLGSPVFDIDKLKWINQHYIQNMTENSFVNFMHNEWLSESILKKLFPLVKERLTSFDEFFEKFSFFFNSDNKIDTDKIIPKDIDTNDFCNKLEQISQIIENISEWSTKAIKEELDKHIKYIAWKPRNYYMPLRMILTGRKDSPPLIETLEALGSDIVRYRIKNAIKEIKNSKHQPN